MFMRNCKRISSLVFVYKNDYFDLFSSKTPQNRKVDEELIELFNSQNNTEIVKLMKKIVPEFISNNSEYVALDE